MILWVANEAIEVFFFFELLVVVLCLMEGG